jgi:hypothetical protein
MTRALQERVARLGREAASFPDHRVNGPIAFLGEHCEVCTHFRILVFTQ